MDTLFEGKTYGSLPLTPPAIDFKRDREWYQSVVFGSSISDLLYAWSLYTMYPESHSFVDFPKVVDEEEGMIKIKGKIPPEVMRDWIELNKKRILDHSKMMTYEQAFEEHQRLSTRLKDFTRFQILKSRELMRFLNKEDRTALEQTRLETLTRELSGLLELEDLSGKSHEVLEKHLGMLERRMVDLSREIKAIEQRAGCLLDGSITAESDEEKEFKKTGSSSLQRSCGHP